MNFCNSIAGRSKVLFLIFLIVVVGIAVGRNSAAQHQVAPPTIPPIQQELITVEPSVGHLWIPGAWERDAEKWDWNEGKWVQPPHETAHWISGYWKLHEQGYHWHEGHWAMATVGMVVQKPITIPTVVTEVVPAAPATGGSWVPGRWEWRAGTWVWLSGYYVQPPHPQAKWTAGAWAKGQLGLWRWIPGHWTT